MVILAAVGEKHATERVIETGYSLASAYGEEVQVLHVLPEEDAQPISSTSAPSPTSAMWASRWRSSGPRRSPSG